MLVMDVMHCFPTILVSCAALWSSLRGRGLALAGGVGRGPPGTYFSRPAGATTSAAVMAYSSSGPPSASSTGSLTRRPSTEFCLSSFRCFSSPSWPRPTRRSIMKGSKSCRYAAVSSCFQLSFSLSRISVSVNNANPSEDSDVPVSVWYAHTDECVRP